MQRKLSSIFSRHAAAIMLAVTAIIAAPSAQAQPSYGETFDPGMPLDQYYPLSRQISDAHIAFINPKSTSEDLRAAEVALEKFTRHENKSLRETALQAVINISGNSSSAERTIVGDRLLMNIMKSGTDESRAYLANNTENLRKTPSYDEFFRLAQTDPNENVRRNLIISLTRQINYDESRDAAALATFINAVRDPSPVVRDAVTDGLIVIGVRKSGKFLTECVTAIETLMKDPNDLVRFNARIAVLRVAAIHEQIMPQALDVAKIALVDPYVHPSFWAQTYPVDNTATLFDRHAAYKTDILKILEDTANGTHPLYALHSASKLAALAARDPATHPIAMRVLPRLITSGNSTQVNIAISAARDIAASNDALLSDSLALLRGVPGKQRAVPTAMAYIAEKKPAAAPVIINALDDIAADTDDSYRASAIDALHRVAAVYKTDDQRFYSIFTRTFNEARSSASAAASQNGLLTITARNAAMADTTFATLDARKASPDPFIREQVAVGMGRLSAMNVPISAQAFAVLSAIATDPVATPRIGAAKGLAAAAGNPALTIDALRAMTILAYDNQYQVKQEIMTALQNMAKLPVAYTPAYIRLLTILKLDTSSSINGPAQTLYSQRMFNDSTTLVPLRNRLESDMPTVISTPLLAPFFIREALPLTGSVDPVTRLKAADMIGQAGTAHGNAASDAVAALAPLTMDYESDIRFTAVRHLGTIGMTHQPAAAAALKALAVPATDDENRIASFAVLAIGKIGKANPALAADAAAILRPLEGSAPAAMRAAIRMQLKMLGP
jgi:HEAT repeat protein